MTIKRGDLVVITNKDNIRGKVVGFYAHSQDALVETKTGNRWIVSPIHLEKIEDKKKK